MELIFFSIRLIVYSNIRIIWCRSFMLLWFDATDEESPLLHFDYFIYPNF